MFRLDPRARRALLLASLVLLTPVRRAETSVEASREVWLDVPAGAATVDLLVDGEPATGSVGEADTPWRVVLAFDSLLSAPLAFRNGAVRLSQNVERLVALGPVEALVVGEELRRTIPPTREPQALSEALSWMRLRESVEGAQEELRSELRAELERESANPEELHELALQALAQEAAMIRGELDALLLWAAENPPEGAGLMVLVGSGFDGPEGFYGGLGVLTAAEIAAVEWPRVDEAAAGLSALGWTVLPLALTEESDALLEGGAGESEADRAHRQLEEDVEAAVVGDDSGDAVLFDAGEIAERLKRNRGEKEAPLLLDPLAGPAELARATGGSVLEDPERLPAALAQLGSRRPVRWSAAPGLHRVEVAGDVDTVRWSDSGTPPALSQARARELLSSESDEGDVPVAALVEAGDAGSPHRLIVETDVAAWPGGAPDRLRITWAAGRADGGVVMASRELGADELDGGRLSQPLGPAFDDRPALAVVVDSPLAPGWGATFAGYVEGGREAGTLEDVDALLLPAPGVIHLLDPGGGVLLGPVTFRTVVSSTEVETVEFYLDGEREGVRRTPPFTADLDLGKLPRIRRVEAVALDGAGRELGRDSMLVNGGAGAFQVTLHRAGEERRGSNISAAGRLTVQADVQAPRERRVQRVEFYWRDELVGVESQPPYRHTVRIPEDRSQGFVRAVATLSDGATAEDVLFVNSPGSAESVEVNLVQLYVVVTDRDGNPVHGLPRDAFSVREEGERREIASFGDAADLPLTLGLAVDASASMFVKLPDVKVAAVEFLRELIGQRDRGFVVGFGGQPRLYSRPSGDLSYLVRGIEAMSPEGHTAIWKAIVYSLVQLQGVPGKKALIVYSDGADEDPDFSYRTARRFARLVGVPVYVILTNNEIVRTQGDGLNVRGFLGRLEELTSEVGGRVFMTRVGQDLKDVYAQIADELRSQYVLGYYAERTNEGEWREIEVDVDRPGLQVLSASGYWH
ncbi:MAG: VWA domain-containing protein [Thermoanaerobaculia bacterium]